MFNPKKYIGMRKLDRILGDLSEEQRTKDILAHGRFVADGMMNARETKLEEEIAETLQQTKSDESK